MAIQYRDAITWRDASSLGPAVSLATSAQLIAGTTLAGWTTVTQNYWPNLMYAVPFWTGYGVTLATIGVQVTVTGSLLQIGVYNVGTGYLPSSAVATAVISAGATGIRVASISATLDPDTTYFAVIWSPVSLTMNGLGANTMFPTYGYANINDTSMVPLGAVTGPSNTGLVEFPIDSFAYVSSPCPKVNMSFLAFDYNS
jgi:hypothetical protein